MGLCFLLHHDNDVAFYLVCGEGTAHFHASLNHMRGPAESWETRLIKETIQHAVQKLVTAHGRRQIFALACLRGMHFDNGLFIRSFWHKHVLGKLVK
jgi:hypothetical protein